MADGRIAIEAVVDTKQFDKQIDYIETQLQDIEYKLKQADMGIEVGDSQKLQAQYERLNNQLKNLHTQQQKVTESNKKMQEQMLATSLSQIQNIGYNEYNGKIAPTFSLARRGLEGFTEGGNLADKVEIVADKVEDLQDAFNVADEDAKQLGDDLEEIGDKGEKAGNRTSNSFDKGVKSLKRFALSLFGIHSIFSIVSRATSNYLSHNQTTANKLNAIWVALGNALGPIIEIIANGVLKLVGYLNVFLQALGFNVDLTKNMDKSSKAIGGTTKAMKELNNQVYAFDEMNKESKDTGVGGAGGGGSNGFTMPELDPKIVAFLQDMAHWLQENWDWIWKVGAALAGVFAVGKLTGVLGGMGSLAGALKTLAGIGIVAVGVDLLYNAITGRDLIEDLKDIIDYLSKMPEYNKKNTEQNKKNVDANEEWIKSMEHVTDGYEKGSEEMKRYLAGLKATAKQSADDNRDYAQRVKNMSGMEYWWNRTTGTIGEYNDRLQDNYRAIGDVLGEMNRLRKENKLTAEEEQYFYTLLDSVNGRLSEQGKVILPALNDTVLDASKKMDYYNGIYDATDGKMKKVGDTTIHYGSTVDNLGRSVEHSGDVGKHFGDTLDNEVIPSIDRSKSSIRTLAEKFLSLNGLVAKPKVEVQTDTKKLSTLLEAMAKLPGVGSTYASLANVFKRIGMASGGIVYNPGRGVALGNAVVGEATNGPEGIIPMNNAESMDMIGQSVAKHTKINLTINTLLDNRVIAREQKIISNDMDFVTNGRGA